MAKKSETAKQWQRRNADKARQYSAKYTESRIKTSVYIEPWVAQKIDKLKDPEQPYGNWIRTQLENWAKRKDDSGSFLEYS